MESNRSSSDDLTSSSLVATVTNSEEEMIVVASEKPKIIDWEELQQELARLWSLSSALKKAEEKKESLGQRIEAIIKVGPFSIPFLSFEL